MCVSITALVDEKYHYPKYSSLEKTFDQAVMWRQIPSLKDFVRPRTKVTLSSGIDILVDCLSFKSYHSLCWIYYMC